MEDSSNSSHETNAKLSSSQEYEASILQQSIDQLLISQTNEIDTLNKKLNTYTSTNNKNIDFLEKEYSSQNIKRDKFFLNNRAIFQNLQTLPSVILNIDLFSNFNFCQILIHEKGKQLANSYDHNKVSNNETTNQIASTKFNEIFRQIKKSKNKLFNQINNPIKEINCIGSFCATTIAFEKHNAIVIISHNDFLPTDNFEQTNFNEIVKSLTPLIFTALLNQQSSHRFEILNQIFKNFSYPFKIIDNNDLTLYENRIHHEGNLNNLTIELDNSTNLIIQLPTEAHSDIDLYHNQRVSLLGELINTLKHELSNPLFGLSLSGQLLYDNETNPENKEIFQDIKTSIERCQTIIKNFSNIYNEKAKSQHINLLNIVNETLLLTKSETKGLNKKININIADDLEVYANPTWLSQIIFNLTVNSAQAFKQAQNLNRLFEINIIANNHGHQAHINFNDNGPGIPEELQNNIFSPFFTTKEKGSGLGLNICQRLARKMNGQLILNHSNSTGTEFHLELPTQKDN